VKTKRAIRSRAEDLYTSPLFRGRRAYVDRTCQRWFILSAKHGLLEPDDLIEPYDVTLTAQSVSERRSWSELVVRDLSTRLGELSAYVFEIHAGAAYRDFGLVAGLQARGVVVVIPTERLSQGAQLAFYAAANKSNAGIESGT